ncbi:hypothetical protein ACO2Q3_20910 [Caulobacter sp. KR2-114]|uniref:hypothetical protein n=1 Tax=Caulobacter sp. KR2-114 TaxID=3400912 RepID=UPI003BFAA881
MPFWSRALAVQEASSLCEALRRHHQQAEVVIDDPEPGGPPGAGDRLSADRLSFLLRSIQRVPHGRQT